MTPAELVRAWRDEADTLVGRYGDGQGARLCRVHADELQAALDAAESEALTLAEAVAVSGYSERRLRELVAEGKLANIGKKGAPRFRRDALPRRATGTPSHYDPARDARDLLAAQGGRM
jgi:hypothetical protein